MFEAVITAEVPHGFACCFLEITAASVGVGGVEFAQKFAQDDVDVVARGARIDEASVPLFHGGPINAVKGWVVEKVAFDAPGVGEDLLPFCFWMDGGFDSFEREVAVAFCTVGCERCGHPCIVSGEEDAFSFGGDFVTGEVFENAAFGFGLDFVGPQDGVASAT